MAAVVVVVVRATIGVELGVATGVAIRVAVGVELGVATGVAMRVAENTGMAMEARKRCMYHIVGGCTRPTRALSPGLHMLHRSSRRLQAPSPAKRGPGLKLLVPQQLVRAAANLS